LSSSRTVRFFAMTSWYQRTKSGQKHFVANLVPNSAIVTLAKRTQTKPNARTYGKSPAQS
jgi:hypothetical protein